VALNAKIPKSPKRRKASESYALADEDHPKELSVCQRNWQIHALIVRRSQDLAMAVRDAMTVAVNAHVVRIVLEEPRGYALAVNMGNAAVSVSLATIHGMAIW